MSGRRFENRYSNDGGGNHIQRIKDENKTGLVLNLNFSTRVCTKCKQIKPTKGGTQTSKPFWLCKECKEKSK